MYFQNYDAESVNKVACKMEAAGQKPNVMVDMSHANSSKDHKNQPSVCTALAKQVALADTHSIQCQIVYQVANDQKGLMGVMIESHINAGSQKLKPGQTDVSSLK